MKYKILSILILLIFMVSCKLIAQKKSDTPIEKSIQSFNALTSETSKYELEFIEEKNTLLLKYEIGEQKRFEYKAILKHIHPEGIFIIEKGNTKFLKVLSINNQKVFIKGKFRGQFRTSNNTNIIEIELPKKITDSKMFELVDNLKSIFIKEENDNPIKMVEPPKTKNE